MRVLGTLEAKAALITNEMARIESSLNALASRYDKSVDDLVSEARDAGENATAWQTRAINLSNRLEILRSNQ